VRVQGQPPLRAAAGQAAAPAAQTAPVERLAPAARAVLRLWSQGQLRQPPAPRAFEAQASMVPAGTRYRSFDRQDNRFRAP